MHDVLAFSHHFIICEYSMPNFQVGFVRAVVQHWKNISLQAGPFARNFGYITSIFFRSAIKCSVNVLISQLPKLTKSSFGHDLVSSNNKIIENATDSTNEENLCST